MQRFVDRANEGKVDYLIAIPSTIEGGYVIYDLLSDRGSIKVRMDNSRDNNSNGIGFELTCKSIKFTQEANEQNVVVEQCKGPTGDIPQHKLFTFDTKR
ncbi:DUF4362 domain-containing protein [Paenibacillus lupini]|uniref:DUF4362 domain-containing protein n=1 Tax=Paenibacillus lupini TaxID=1450204 RepID=UPI00141E76B9|nr:hypothetical protein [Paenibacillus lupini]